MALNCPSPAALRAACCLLLPLWLLGACAGGARSYVDDKVEGAEIDYRARHERMLQVVLLRPAQMEAQRLERERLERAQDTEAWDAVMARHDVFVQQRRDTRQRDQEQFERLLARQRGLSEVRERGRTERWAQFIEQRAPGPEATPGGAPAPASPAP